MVLIIGTLVVFVLVQLLSKLDTQVLLLSLAQLLQFLIDVLLPQVEVLNLLQWFSFSVVLGVFKSDSREDAAFEIRSRGAVRLHWRQKHSPLRLVLAQTSLRSNSGDVVLHLQVSLGKTTLGYIVSQDRIGGAAHISHDYPVSCRVVLRQDGRSRLIEVVHCPTHE